MEFGKYDKPAFAKPDDGGGGESEEKRSERLPQTASHLSGELHNPEEFRRIVKDLLVSNSKGRKMLAESRGGVAFLVGEEKWGYGEIHRAITPLFMRATDEGRRLVVQACEEMVVELERLIESDSEKSGAYDISTRDLANALQMVWDGMWKVEEEEGKEGRKNHKEHELFQHVLPLARNLLDACLAKGERSFEAVQCAIVILGFDRRPWGEQEAFWRELLEDPDTALYAFKAHEKHVPKDPELASMLGRVLNLLLKTDRPQSFGALLCLSSLAEEQGERVVPIVFAQVRGDDARKKLADEIKEIPWAQEWHKYM